MSEVQTGMAKFGDGGFGVVTRNDMVKLVMWAISFAKSAAGNEGYEIRKLVRKLLPMMAPADLLALADLADSCHGQWPALASEMRELANKPLFKQ